MFCLLILILGRCLEFCESSEGILGNSAAWRSLCTSTCSRNLKGSLWEWVTWRFLIGEEGTGAHFL